MRIDPNVVAAPIARDSREASASTKTGDTSSSSEASSVVKLSTAGAAASSDIKPAATTTSRLDTIRAMLDKGAYPVDLDVLASRIVDDEFLRAGRS